MRKKLNKKKIEIGGRRAAAGHLRPPTGNLVEGSGEIGGRGAAAGHLCPPTGNLVEGSGEIGGRGAAAGHLCPPTGKQALSHLLSCGLFLSRCVLSLVNEEFAGSFQDENVIVVDISSVFLDLIGPG